MKRSTMWMMRAACLAALAVGLASLARDTTPLGAEETSPAAAETHTFVGGFEEGHQSARVGVAVDGKNYLIYVCSDDTTFNNDHATWFKGEYTGATLTASNGMRALKATVKGDTVTGELTSDGKTLRFTAKNCDGHVVAGLYRAEEDVDGKPVIFGWVVDADGNIAGGVQRPGAKGTGVVPNNGLLNGLKGQGNPKGQGVNGQKVQGPVNPPKGTRAKVFAPERRAEFLTRLQNNAPRNGNPLLVGMIHLMKRFESGAKAEGAVETAAFNQFRRMPKQVFTDYLKNWDGLPAAVRQRLAGPELANVDAKKAVTPERFGGLIQASGIRQGGKPVARSAAVPVLKQVTVKQLEAKDTTGEVSDEIFAVYVIGTGNQLFTKTTAVLTGIRNNDKKTFAAADQVVFPPAEQPNLVSAEDVLITATLFEQDGNIDLIKNLVKVIVDAAIVTVAIVTAPAGAAAGGFVVPANILIDQIAAGLPAAATLGTVDFRATPDGKLKKINNNTTINELQFKESARRGPGPFDFRLSNLDVKN